MNDATVIELHITPDGIVDWESRKFSTLDWQEIGRLLELFSDNEEIRFQPHDNFKTSLFPSEYTALEDLIKLSNGNIGWQFPPRK